MSKRLPKVVKKLETQPKREKKSDIPENDSELKIDIGKKWSRLTVDLDNKIMKAIESFGFTQMTPVQENAIPLLLSHKDLVAEAATGSGKTLAYLIPVFQMLINRERNTSHIGACVIVPTRELAQQVYEVAQVFSQHTGISIQLVTGGKFDNTDYHAEVTIATPGRLSEVLEKRQYYDITLKNFEILIIDEADRILDMGFEKQINQILNVLPKQRRTGLFSATQTTEMHDLIRSGLRNPVKVTVQVDQKNDSKTPKELSNFFMFAHQDEKLDQLIHFLNLHKDTKVIVYFLTCACVDYFARILRILLPEQLMLSLHGQMAVERREKTYEQFVAGDSGVLICTDVAARGLDIKGVEYIIQFDPPLDPSVFVHRAGRTARMGKSGVAIVFIEPHEDEFVHLLTTKKVPIKEIKAAEIKETHLDTLKQEILNDRDLLEKSEAAFISFLRAYKEHQCSYIFKFHKLDLDRCAKGYSLLRHPKNVFRNFTLKFTFAEEEMDFETIAFKDPKREEARQQRILNPKPKKEKPKIEREKGVFERKQEIRQLPTKKRRKRAMTAMEYDNLSNEMSLLKKVKKGEITEKEYEVLTGEIDFHGGSMDKPEKKPRYKKKKKVSRDFN